MHPWTRSRAIAGFAGVLIVLAACAPAQSPTAGSTSPQGQTQPTGPQRLVIGQASITPQMHPYISICCTQRRYDVFDPVLHQKDDGSVEPGAATAWKSVDPTTWEFTIRQDMKFHDGTPMRADDVVFSIKRASDISFKYAITSRLETIADASKVNETTVRVVTKQPDGLLLKRMAMVSVLPQAYLERVGDAEFGNKAIGTGPFRLVEFVPDSKIVVRAIPEHPFRKATGVTEVEIRNVPEAAARVAGLKSGELDMADTIPIDQADSLKAAGFNVIVVDSGSSTGYWLDTVVGRQPKTGPMADRRVRLALNYAIDKELVAKNIYKGYTKPEQGQFVQPETFGFNPNLKMFPYDPNRAKQLLAEAGYANGFKLTLAQLQINAEANAQALLVQDQLRQIGVELEIQPIGEYAVFRDYFYGVRQRTDLFAPGLINTPALDADFALVWFCTCQADPGRWHYNNPEFDRVYQQSVTEVNETRRKELLQRAIEIIHNDPPYLFMVQGTRLIFANKKVQGLARRAADIEQRYERLSIR
ncbi:MAG: diguanylate phosphodiesterase [Dehalococcoidia bacterium]|nr:MAG: diguanylate phosphodiesterase [Dehalococcoidia bacterium]